MRSLAVDVRDHLGDGNYVHFPDVKWSDTGGMNEEIHSEYLEKFGSMFKEKVMMLIDRVDAAVTRHTSVTSHVYIFQRQKYCHL